MAYSVQRTSIQKGVDREADWAIIKNESRLEEKKRKGRYYSARQGENSL